jgi:hypothetical protein
MLCGFTMNAASAQYGWYGYPGFGGGYPVEGAATAGESYARGLADVIRSRSMAAVASARAAEELEEARKKYLENRDYAARSFVERRALRDQYREQADNTFYKSDEKLAKYVESRRLKPLTSSEFYEPTGDISWPLVLSLPEDSERRKRVSELFAKRADEGSLPPEQYVELNELLRQWRTDLINYEDQFPRSDLARGARFLNRLAMTLQGDFEAGASNTGRFAASDGSAGASTAETRQPSPDDGQQGDGESEPKADSESADGGGENGQQRDSGSAENGGS